MGMTIAEKIIAAAAGVDYVKPGDIHTVTLDRMMSNDGTTHLTVDMYRNKLKHPHIADTKKMVFIVDHNVPSDCPKTAASQKKMRDFAKENNIDFWEGKGVCHQVMMLLRRSRRLRYRSWMYRPPLRHGDRKILGSCSGDCKIQPRRKAAGRRLRERPDLDHHRHHRRKRLQLPGYGVHRRRR